MEEVDSLNKSQGDTKPQSKLVMSDAGAQQSKAEEEHPYWVDGKPVSREEYLAALPKAGYDPVRMPANHYPSINTK